MRCKYILLRIDIYFSECFLEVEIDEKGQTYRGIIFEEKRQKALEKKFGCKFIIINTSNAKNGYDLDYDVGNIQAFIDKFKNKKIKKTRKKLIKEKEMREKGEKEMREKVENEMREKVEKAMKEKVKKEMKEKAEKKLEREIRQRNERKIRKRTKRQKQKI